MRGPHQIPDHLGDLHTEMGAVHLQSLSGQISVYLGTALVSRLHNWW